jgi:hypothetical protein
MRIPFCSINFFLLLEILQKMWYYIITDLKTDRSLICGLRQNKC